MKVDNLSHLTRQCYWVYSLIYQAVPFLKLSRISNVICLTVPIYKLCIGSISNTNVYDRNIWKEFQKIGGYAFLQSQTITAFLLTLTGLTIWTQHILSWCDISRCFEPTLLYTIQLQKRSSFWNYARAMWTNLNCKLLPHSTCVWPWLLEWCTTQDSWF